VAWRPLHYVTASSSARPISAVIPSCCALLLLLPLSIAWLVLPRLWGERRPSRCCHSGAQVTCAPLMTALGQSGGQVARSLRERAYSFVVSHCVFADSHGEGGAHRAAETKLSGQVLAGARLPPSSSVSDLAALAMLFFGVSTLTTGGFNRPVRCFSSLGPERTHTSVQRRYRRWALACNPMQRPRWRLVFCVDCR
jgi:hypothetical protein